MKTTTDILHLTNLNFSKTDEAFLDACIKAKIIPSTRQASKWRRGKGIAKKVLMEIAEPLKKGQPGCRE